MPEAETSSRMSLKGYDHLLKQEAGPFSTTQQRCALIVWRSQPNPDRVPQREGPRQGSGQVGRTVWVRKMHQVDISEVSLINYKEAGGHFLGGKLSN